MFCLNPTTLLVASLPVLVLKDELPQLEVSEDQAIVVAVRHSWCYLMEKSGSLFLLQLLASANERVHVTMASFEEYVRPRIPQKNLHYLVNILMDAQHKVSSQGLLVSTDIKHLEERGHFEFN